MHGGIGIIHLSGIKPGWSTVHPGMDGWTGDLPGRSVYIGRIVKTSATDAQKRAEPVEDGVSLWMDAYGRAEYGKIIYFAKRIPESLEEFSGGEISILLCDGIPADNRWNTMVYHAQTFAEDLQMVVL